MDASGRLIPQCSTHSLLDTPLRRADAGRTMNTLRRCGWAAAFLVACAWAAVAAEGAATPSAPAAAGTPAAAQVAPAAAQAVPAPLVTPPPPARPESPALAAISAREARVDGICNRLLSELSGAPPLVRELLRRPEQTVEALRSASRELARRERELRGMLSEDEGERLLGERAELAARAEAAPDAVVRSRLAAALEALDAQLVHRAELTTAAARIEAEGTRILYSLESLRAQVLRAFAADAAAADVTRESLKWGLETLRGEIDAVATALEEVHGVGTPSVSSTAGGGPTAAARAAMRQAGTR